MCVPVWVRENEGFAKQNTEGYLTEIYNNIDLAIHGHIHYSAGVVRYELTTGKTVPIWIPGALAITQNKEIFKHPSVQLPLLVINDDSTVSYVPVTLGRHLGQTYEILEGLQDGQKVVTKGQTTLKDGIKVNVL